MITVAANAAARVKALLGKAGRPNIRIRVIAGGCSGLEYKVEPAGEPGDGDLAFVQAGFKVLIDKQHVVYVAGSELVLEESLMQTSFRLKNPNALQTCSCGTSFSVGDDHEPVPCCTNTHS